MAITVTLIGTGVEQGAAGGTNATASVTSQSATWVAGDYVLVALGVHHNFGSDWVGTGLSSSGGALAAATISTTSPNLAMGGYKSGASFLLAQVTTGFTGTITASRTAGSADHWLTGTFYKVTGIAGTITQAKTNSQAAGTNTLALNFTSAPASTSLIAALLICNSNDAWSTLTGFTEVERAETSWLADHSVQYKNGSGAQNNTFTVASNSGGVAGIIVEIADAGGGGSMPIVPERLVVLPTPTATGQATFVRSGIVVPPPTVPTRGIDPTIVQPGVPAPVGAATLVRSGIVVPPPVVPTMGFEPLIVRAGAERVRAVTYGSLGIIPPTPTVPVFAPLQLVVQARPPAPAGAAALFDAGWVAANEPRIPERLVVLVVPAPSSRAWFEQGIVPPAPAVPTFAPRRLVVAPGLELAVGRVRIGRGINSAVIVVYLPAGGVAILGIAPVGICQLTVQPAGSTPSSSAVATGVAVIGVVPAGRSAAGINPTGRTS